MRLARVQLRDFRLFAEASLDCGDRFNLIIGDNGAGKSSLLEAIYVLGRGASHRAGPRLLVRDGAERWAVDGLVADAATGAPPQHLRVAWINSETRIEWGASALGIGELVRRLPVQILDPALHRLIDEGPGVRRRWIDWGLFHVEPSFIEPWRRSQRALRQRNAALRSGAAPSAVTAWNRELAEAGEMVDKLRCAHLEALESGFRRILTGLLPGQDWQFRYQRGWSAEQTYLQALQAGQDRDVRLGQTLHGPHRAELMFSLEGRGVEMRARGRISRGQQKLLVCAFVLAQCDMVRAAQGAAPVLLVDDFAAELSADSQSRLAAALAVYPGQLFVAALETGAALEACGDARMFHVEHGKVSALIK